MKKIFIILFSLFSFLSSVSFCNAQIITTIAGTGVRGYSGDNGLATAAEITGPGGDVLFDYAGNIYFDDEINSCIRKINSAGIITTIAGTSGLAGFSGDGGSAALAEFNENTVITFDSSKDMYVADAGNNRIRKIDASGDISTVVGNGVGSFSGNGGLATSAEIYYPTCIIVDDTGNLYVDDTYNNQIRKVNTAGIITQFAGTGTPGFSGDGGDAKLAEIYCPYRIIFDNKWNMYITDSYNNRIRKINRAGIITTVAGNGTGGYSGDGGQATLAELNSPYGTCIDAKGNMYIADAQNNRIREIDTNGVITTLAGDGTAGYRGDGGPSTASELSFPAGLSLDYEGNLYIDDYNNNRIRKITFSNKKSGINRLQFNGEMTIFPNPSTGIFTVKLGSGEIGNITVYNILGDQVINEKLAGSTSLINLSKQSNGTYFYKVLTEDGNLIGQGKLILEK